MGYMLRNANRLTIFVEFALCVLYFSRLMYLVVLFSTNIYSCINYILYISWVHQFWMVGLEVYLIALYSNTVRIYFNFFNSCVWFVMG